MSEFLNLDKGLQKDLVEELTNVYQMMNHFQKNADGILAWCLSAENMEAKLIILTLIAGSAAALIYTGLQKITYDQRQIEICRFPRGVVRMNWNEVRKTECRREENGYRTLILYTDRKNYLIREKQFRKGFSELLKAIGNVAK